MNEIDYLKEQIGILEAQKKEALILMERSEGALQVCRGRLGYLMRQQDEEKTKTAAEQRGAASTVEAASNGEPVKTENNDGQEIWLNLALEGN